MTSNSGENLHVPIYYCAEANGTIISPNSIQQLYSNTYRGFHIFCDCDNKTGHLKFYHRNGLDHAIFNAYSTNNLWYHDMSGPNTNNESSPNTPSYHHSSCVHPKINKINKIAKHEVWHQRRIHPGERCMRTISKHVNGIDKPLIGNCFYSCAACMHRKPRKSDRSPKCHETSQTKEQKDT